ncbi:flavin reductase family protein [Sphaerisporangium sp. TRM90804]|uniref:flavin reductase family protein n=1 Tax=Sphaerisporangium sp. TRM90804 TaxID=3031113 RepID=UPI00244C06CF|nr:flavin reductase family protein [Sphaerisporangium sp. TRM90804]MDH2427304.1 flavin reductase family protein [Sphaerisporangium sp. TRM90804]
MSAREAFPATSMDAECTAPDMFPMTEVDHRPDRPPPSVDSHTFRTVMGSFASGVCVVTTTDGAGVPRGFTCSAVCSVSAEPPLLLAGVSNRSGTLAAVLVRGRFAVNMLDHNARQVSQVFASPLPDKFDRVRWGRGRVSGMPVLADVVAHAECELERTVPAGDHTLLMGRLIGGGCGPDRLPLAYWRGGYAEVLR